MRPLLTLSAAALLSLSMGVVAAEVEYQHPVLTIVANDEPLDSVLKSVSTEMRIFVTTPAGLKSVVTCDIQGQPIKQAFKKLLGDMSYSLKWKDDGERLVGLTILSGTEDSVAVTDVEDTYAVPSGRQSPALPTDNRAGVSNSTMANDPRGEAAPMPMDDSAIAVERQDQEVRTAEEQEEREIEMELRRQEEVIAHEAQMAEEVVRNQAEMDEYFESQGINPNP